MSVGNSLHKVGPLDFGVIKYLKTSVKRQDHWEKWIQQEELSLFMGRCVVILSVYFLVIYDNFRF